MINKIKDISIKNHIYYFFNDIININVFDPNNIKIDEKSYKTILIYYIRYVTIKDSKYVKINSENPLHLINKANGNKYLTLVPTNESKEKIKNMKSCGVKSEIRLITENSDDYDENI